MALFRTLSLTFYILYLIVLAVALFFLLYYSNVPIWVWSLFLIAILIAIIGVLMKEFLLVRTITVDGVDVTSGYYTFWLILYIVLHLIAIALIIVGLFFVIQYSTIPWWVWLILFLAFIVTIFSNMIRAFFPNSYVWSIIFSLIGLVLFIVGIVFLILYSNSPFWVWLILGIAILFAILSGIFESLSEPNYIVLLGSQQVNVVNNCQPQMQLVPTVVPTQTCETIQTQKCETVPVQSCKTVQTVQLVPTPVVTRPVTTTQMVTTPVTTTKLVSTPVTTTELVTKPVTTTQLVTTPLT